MYRWRGVGLPLVASLLLIGGAAKLWQANTGATVAGALFGCGLLLLGVAVRDWIDHHTHNPDEEDRR